MSVSPENVATPLAAVAVSVPPKVALPGLFASATVTVPSNEVIGLPELFSAVTVRPNPLPAVTLAGGCCVTTSCDVVRVATPIELVPGSSEPDVAVGPRRDRGGRLHRIGDRVFDDGVGRRVDRAELAGRTRPGLPLSVNQRLPSGPAVIPSIPGFAVGVENVLLAPVVGFMSPRSSALAVEVNQRLPSLPTVRPTTSSAAAGSVK